MFNTKLGIEIEFTGITRNKAAKVIADHLNGAVESLGDYYDKKQITAPDGRKWLVMYDSSIRAQKKENGVRVAAQDIYKCELVSPILTYNNDMAKSKSKDFDSNCAFDLPWYCLSNPYDYD